MKKFPFLFALVAAASPAAFMVAITPTEARPVYVNAEVSPAAVGGYDVVSYFRGNGSPVKGTKLHSAQYDSATYYFASADNADAFKENPAAFAPQYGGHCAWAMSRGSLAPGDPTLYKVVDGKLYLNFNKQVQKTWLGDIPGFISKADAAWPTIPDDASFG